MSSLKTDYIWMNGQLVRWEDAKIHILSHVVHYGSSVFEGMRAYKTLEGPACFRLKEHVDRLFNSAKIYRMELPYTREEITNAIIDTVNANGAEECYVRPLVYRGFGRVGVDPSHCPVDVAIATWYWGQYLGEEALEKGVSVCVSSWRRMAPDTMPTMAKAGANYMNGQLIKLEAIANGYVEGIALDTFGYVSEGSGENIFIIRDGVLYTPPISAAILPGITRDSLLTLAHDLGIKVAEQNILREALYIADEVFMCGSASEVTPVTRIDKQVIGSGVAGVITKKLQKAFFDIVECKVPDRHNWLTFVRSGKRVSVPK